jgi:diaminohydroxyphosphoribosylaminopyrimidine deaminase/5-amino-6-(5-phosphoribosylamino)uracil reductase
MELQSMDEFFMNRCLQLAKKGEGYVDPNPLVGSVIVLNNRVIGEGFHARYGEAHAEVNAINSVSDKSLLKSATIYVSLEPCSHHGKTPPCADLIIHHKIPKVVIGMQDPFLKVNGSGISRLQQAGCEVKTGVLEKECYQLNKAFITFHTKKRPYLILKWAQTLDGFIDKTREPGSLNESNWITDEVCRSLVHKWRSEIPAIMVGKNTASLDNPRLDTRFWGGRNPVRIVTDQGLDLPKHLHLFDQSQKTIVLNALKNDKEDNLEYLKIDFGKGFLNSLMELLYQKEINSLLVEGGQQLLQSFINQNYWDEARIFTGNKYFTQGVSAPKITGYNVGLELIGNSQLSIIKNLL